MPNMPAMISKQRHKSYDRIAIVNQIWHGLISNAMLQAWATHGTWLLYQIWTKSTCSPVRYHNKHTLYERITIISQIWYRAKVHFTCISNLRPLVPNMKKNPPSHYGGMFDDGQTDQTLSYIPWSWSCVLWIISGISSVVPASYVRVLNGQHPHWVVE